jgi:hypothetical protein
VTFSNTQNFVQKFLTPQSPYKGMLLFHSVGSGKTCTAIATATNTFDREGYKILWVTRHTLKEDIWKNMFDKIAKWLFEKQSRQVIGGADPSGHSAIYIRGIGEFMNKPQQALHTVFKAACASAAVIGLVAANVAYAADAGNGKVLADTKTAAMTTRWRAAMRDSVALARRPRLHR